MKTIGQILKLARVSKKYSLSKLEEITKIRSSFIDALEKEKWEALPPFPTVLGFVKNISQALEVNSKNAVAVLKRDYPPRKLRVNPKPDVGSKFHWGPKLTFFTGVFIILSFLAGYLIFQYVNFISPPHLSVESPKDGQIISGRSVNVFGTTDSDAKITVNDQPVSVSDDGKFSLVLEIAPDTSQVKIVAQSRSGKTSSVSRKIVVQN